MAERQVTFVDTNVLACAHDRSETRKQPVAQAQLAALWRDRTGARSTQVLQDFQYDPVACAVAAGWTGAVIEQQRLHPVVDGEVVRFPPATDGRPTSDA